MIRKGPKAPQARFVRPRLQDNSKVKQSPRKGFAFLPACPGLPASLQGFLQGGDRAGKPAINLPVPLQG